MEIEYNDLFEFVNDSSSKYDFLERLSVCTSIILDELNSRIKDSIFPFQIVPVIDKMNQEVNELVENVNSIHLYMCLPKLQTDMLYRLIGVINPVLYSDYIKQKYILQN